MAGMRNAVWAAVLAAALALLAPAFATAGTYDVLSCRAPGAGGGNLAWKAGYGAYPNPDPQPGQFDVIEECPGPRSFLLARSRAADGVDAFWAHSAYFRVDAPPNTTISRIQLWRHGQSVRADGTDGGGDEWDVEARTDDGDLSLERCVIPEGQTECNVGAREDLNGKGLTNASKVNYDVDTPWAYWGVSCNPPAFKSCATANGLGYPYGSLNLWGSIVTIRDEEKPALVPSGALWNEGWRRPDEALVYDASDSAGIRSVRAEIGGVVAVANGSCDFRRPAPCPGRLNGAFRFEGDPPDGAHSAAIMATDAAGNETTASRTLLIDGNPPRVDLRPPRKRTMIVRVADDGSGVAAGQIYVRQGSDQPYHALPTTFSGRALRAPLDRGNPAQTDVRVLVRDNVGNEINGVPARFTLTSIRSGKRSLKLVKRNVRARFGGSVTFRGKLTLSADQPLVGVPVLVISSPLGGGAPVQEAVARTSPTGRFAVTIGKGPSRNIVLSYPGVDDGLPASRGLRLGVAATSSIKASRRTLNGAGLVRFRGRVRDGRKGLVVVLQGREQGRWRTFVDTRTGPKGRWRTAYRFSGRPGSYPIRVRIRRQAGLPYETGHSRAVAVRVA